MALTKSQIRYRRSRMALNNAKNRKLQKRIGRYKPNQIYRYTQLQNMYKANINVSTGAATSYNPTSTITYLDCTSTNITADSSFAMFFKFSDLVQYATFGSLYDSYRIDKIEVTIGGTVSDQPALGSAANLLVAPQQVWYVVDTDDANVLANLTEMYEYSAAKCIYILQNQTKKITIKPQIAYAAYGAGAFTQYATKQSPWIDCAYPDVQHYGLKVILPCPKSTTYAGQSVTVMTKYFMSFKSVK